MRIARFTNAFFWGFTLLSAYIIARTLLGLPFQIWLGFLHPILAFTFVLLHAWQRFGGRGTGLFLLLAVVLTLLAEILGVTTGWPFGRYHYTERLGPLFLGLVPYLIPMVWFNMLYPSLVIADRLSPSGVGRWRRWLSVAALGAVAMTAWDLVVDPVMVAGGHWVWENKGAYFGIPLQNYFGWWLTSFVMLFLFLALGKVMPARVPAADDRLAVGVYALTGGTNLVIALHVGLMGPALAGLLAMFPWVVLGLREKREAENGSVERE